MSCMDMGSMDMGSMNMRDESLAPPDMEVGVGVDMIAMNPQDSAGKPPLGLEDVGHRVLVYTDLVALDPNPDPREPTRSMEIHLTGNMERRSEEHTSERQSLMRNSYAVFCLKKKNEEESRTQRKHNHYK